MMSVQVSMLPWPIVPLETLLWTERSSAVTPNNASSLAGTVVVSLRVYVPAAST